MARLKLITRDRVEYIGDEVVFKRKYAYVKFYLGKEIPIPVEKVRIIHVVSEKGGDNNDRRASQAA